LNKDKRIKNRCLGRSGLGLGCLDDSYRRSGRGWKVIVIIEKSLLLNVRTVHGLLSRVPMAEPGVVAVQ
jgi:hypothetical protein